MKDEIHPKFYKDATFHCACGNTIKAGATKEHLEIEICSNCHPFYTGKKKVLDTMGRVEKFRKKMEKKESISAKKKK